MENTFSMRTFITHRSRRMPGPGKTGYQKHILPPSPHSRLLHLSRFILHTKDKTAFFPGFIPFYPPHMG